MQQIGGQFASKMALVKCKGMNYYSNTVFGQKEAKIAVKPIQV